MSSLIRPIAILCAFVVGWLFPQGAALRFLIPYFVGFMIFATFVGLDARNIAFKKSHVAILCANLLIPLLAYWIVGAFERDGSQLALAAFFTGIAPTATAAPAVAGFLNRKTEYVVVGLLLTTFVVGLALPLLLPWILQTKDADVDFWVGVRSVGKSVLLTMALPIVLARLTRAFIPGATALIRRGKNVTFGAWVAMVAIICCRASEFIRDPRNGVGGRELLEIGAISLVVCVVNFVLGYFLGERDFREEASQTLGQKNTGATIVFATLYAEPLVALGPTFYVLWHNSWNAAQLARVARRERARAEEPTRRDER